MASDSFVSFPRFDELVVEESLADKLTGKLQRLWAAATPSSTNNPPPAAPIYSPQLSTAHSNSYLSNYAQEPAPAAPSSRQTSASQPPLLPSELSTRPSAAVPITSGAKLPTRQFVRPIRVSGVSPSILLTIANSEKGIQAPGPRSHVSDYRFAGDGFLGGGVHGSPTASESFANLAQLTSIPGFALDRIEGVDDSKSIRSVGSFARPSASVAHIFRRMRGEGLSKNYWISDELSKECFDCQTVFTAFRRKHHCRICGQIFCSRCASNIISSARFGHQGVVRVCNLCLSIMEDGDPSPEDSAPASRFRSGLRDSSPLTISAPLEASARPPQSQFAASHLFPRNDIPYHVPPDDNFGRISESSSRAGTPVDYFEDDSVSVRASGLGSPLNFDISGSGTSPVIPAVPAPFRRGLAEDDKGIVEVEGEEIEAEDGLGITDAVQSIALETVLEVRSIHEGGAVKPPTTLAAPPPSLAVSDTDLTAPALVAMIGQAAMDQPPGETSYTPTSKSLSPVIARLSPPLDKNAPAVLDRSKSPSVRPYVSDSGFIFQDLPHDGPGPDPRDLQRILSASGPYRDLPLDTAPAVVKMPESTHKHLRSMLRQSLDRAGVPHPGAWEKQLMKLLIKVAKYPAPNVREGDDIDVRHYVHIKKIPGGQPRDSEFVDGVVFTKNVVHKQMARELTNPRIMLFSFGLEYQRVENQLTSLEPLLKQEREYLKNLVARIVAQRPHIILVERNVSRLALEYLLEANVAVARNVKPEVIEIVARLTQSDIISSMDKLALEPRLGRCETFKVQTFVHSMIPGRRKTFMRFEGCNKELGCTLILRGGTLDDLAKVKDIVEMMVMVVYSAKLEGYLVRDELVMPTPNDSPPPYPLTSSTTSTSVLDTLNLSDRERISQEIAASLRPYQTTILSGSPTVRLIPPYPLSRMSEVDRRATTLRQLCDYEETEQIIHEEETSRLEKEASEMSMSSSTSSLSSLVSDQSRAVSFSEPYVPAPIDPLKILQTPQELARVSELAEAEARYAEQLVLWTAYVEQNKDSLNPVDHQQIIVLETLSCGQIQQHCSPPTIRAIPFYGKDDCTIGQYIERVCREAGKPCVVSNCRRPMMAHFRTWIHGSNRLTISCEAFVPNLERHLQDTNGEAILMYGSCRECPEVPRAADETSPRGTGQHVMSEETYRMSFAKYLELSFYPDYLTRNDGRCEHTAHGAHTRYWGYRGITLQIVVDRVPLSTIVAPPLVLKIKPEKQLELRNEEYITVLKKSTAFWDSIDHRIASFNYELVQADRIDECRAAMKELSTKCQTDRRAILRLLETTYEQAQATNGTEMTSVRRTLQNKAVDWEAEWTSFEHKIIPTEKDVRRLTTVQLKRLFSDGALPTSPERRPPSSILSTAVEADEKGDLAGSPELTIPAKGLPLTKEQLDKLDADMSVYSLSTLSSSQTTATSIAPYIHPRPVVAACPSDNESDSTVCAESASLAMGPVNAPGIGRRVSASLLDDTSGAESEYNRTPSKRRPTTGPGVADLVNFFSDTGGDSASSSTKPPPISRKSPSANRPPMRRGATDKPRSLKMRANELFSDGDGSSSYARNVGVSHLSNRAFADKPSRIPARKVPSKTTPLSALFGPSQPSRRQRLSYTAGDQSASGSPSQSRSVSRSGSISGRSTPSLSAHRMAAEGSNSTLKASESNRTPDAGSTKGKARESSMVRSDSTPRVLVKANKAKPSKDLGVARPTTSSTNKATSVRRVVSGSNTSGHRVSTIANHFNKITRDADRERTRRLALFRGKRPRPVAVAHPTVEVFDNVKDAAKEDSDDEDNHSSDGADDEYDDDVEQDVDDQHPPHVLRQTGGREISVASTAESFVYEQGATREGGDALLHHPATLYPLDHQGEIRLDVLDPSAAPSGLETPSAKPSPLPPTVDSATLPRMSEGDSSGNERGSIIKAISNLWAYRGGDFTPLEYPLHASEHIFADNPILVREDEPSSILAFTLSSKAYRDKLKEQDITHVTERSEAFMPDETFVPGADRSSTWGLLDVQVDGNDVEETLRKPGAKHFRLQFEEGSTNFFCKIFFAEQFDALRQNCGCGTQFIESLARCVKWESSGGRSKVDFLKTRDDRFIVKEISRLEMDALLRFAPAYFEYMSKAFFHGLPTILAKIFGFYRIGLRNPATGKVMRLDILVMENLFYERQLSQVYDLKGSTRNRLVVTKQGKSNEVLMDENLVATSFEQPLYVREGSKRFLKTAIFNDTLFLSNLNVMDYSLVVGVDTVKDELVVGIVDFIRTYTWDKKLESWVKDSAFLGGGFSKAGGPTIVTPKQYKTRFRDAMDGYFRLAPDTWLDPSSLLPVGSNKAADKETFAAAPDGPSAAKQVDA